jgi:hypothetical protein
MNDTVNNKIIKTARFIFYAFQKKQHYKIKKILIK